MDGTFNVFPRSFNQVFNIVGYNPKKDIILLVMACLLNVKTEKIYDNVFNEFKKLIKYAKISLDYSKLKIMSDFELTLRKSIRNNFNESELMGCYFQFIKIYIHILKKYVYVKKKFVEIFTFL